jgi:hypothetical protein
LPIGDAYATKAELKGYAEHFTDTVDDTQLDEVLLQASRAIEHYCQRQFNKATSATAKVFYPDQYYVATVDDFWTTASLAIATDQGNDGTYEVTWAATDYQLEPLNQVVDGETGWAYYRIRAVGNQRFPCVYLDQRAPLQVTAQWGWNAVPTNVKVACIYLALETFKLKGAPFGVANFDQFGPIRVRDNPKVMNMLAPYRLVPLMVA